MANRKATFAKRQRETDLKDRAKAKGERRAQKRTEVRDVKGPEIAWGEAVHAVTTNEDDELPPLPGSRHEDDAGPDADDAPAPEGAGDANTNNNVGAPAPAAAPRRLG
jgi:hypothetical protein